MKNLSFFLATAFLLSSFSAFAQVSNGLIAKYSFNTAATWHSLSAAIDDTGHGLLGAIYGATPTYDRFGNPQAAYRFDGVNDFIDLGDPDSFRMGTNDFSISIWVKYTASQHGFIIGKRAGAAADFDMYSIVIAADPYNGGASQELRTLLRSSNSTDRILAGGNLGDGDWHHIVLVNDYDTKSYYYIDGQLLDSSATTFSGNFDVAGFTLSLGYSSESNSAFYNGDLDDVRIYNRALNALEADSLFNEPAPVFALSESLVAKYLFDDGTANDGSGNSLHGTINGAVPATDRFGNAGKAFQFGANQTIAVPDADTLDGMSQSLTVSFWLQAPPITTNTNNLISKFSFCGGGVDAYNIRLNTEGKIWAQIDDATGFDSYQVGDAVVADNTWHLITIVWNRPNVTIYVDGVADMAGSYTPFDSQISNAPDSLSFGHVLNDFCTASYEYGEKLDDIRIYSRALGQTEIDSLLNQPNPVIIGTTALDESANALQIYPNPTKSALNFSQAANVQLFSPTGQLLMEARTVQQIDISAYAAGLYFLLFFDEEGKYTQRAKVLKE